MKTKLTLKAATALLLLATFTTFYVAQPSTCHAQGTAFTYQGRLNEGGNPANGIFDFQFAIYDSSGGPGVVAGPLTNSPVPVTNGLFTVTLDFGAGVFTGADRWLDIALRTNGGGVFTALAPRQKLTPTPYAVYAPNAGNAATAAGVATDAVPTAGLQNSSVTSGKILDGTITATDVNSASFSNTLWKVDGNAGTTPGTHFLGTTDSQPLELKVNRLRALRLEPTGDSVSDGDALPDGAPNVIAGSPSNYVYAGVVGATISGGGATNYSGFARPNIVAADYAVIGGGRQNAIYPNAAHATIDGGWNNTVHADALASTIGGGWNNQIHSGQATIGGGAVNTISASYAGIGGGGYNQIQFASTYSTIGGGFNNEIRNDSPSATIGGGNYVTIHTNCPQATVSGGQYNEIFPDSQNSVIGGGNGNTIGTNSPDVTIGGGVQNTVENSGYGSTIGGGVGNSIQPYAYTATIGGGEDNSVGLSAAYAMIPGGRSNHVGGMYSLAAGRQARALYDGTFVWADAQAADFASTGLDQFLVRAAGGVGINTNNPSGAALNVAGEIRAGFFAGSGSGLSGLNASQLTSGTLPASALSGTYSSAVALNNGGNSFTGNGSGLTSLDASQLASGTVPDARLSGNVALRNATQSFTGNNAFFGTVGIGTSAAVTALTVATGIGYGIEHTDGSRRLGTYLDVNGCWLGSVSADPLRFFVNNGASAVTIDLSSRVGIGRAPAANKLEVEGDASKTTAGSWLANSDARIKEDLQPITSALEKLERVRLVSFRYTDDYRAQHPGVENRRYLNVVAQEFREVFPEHVKSSGEKLPDGSEILQVDLHPLAIYSAVAVQELHRELKRRDAENAELKHRLEKLERMLNEKNGGAR